MTRIIVQTMPGSPWMSYLLGRLPDLELAMDCTQNAWDTFVLSMEMQGADPAIHIEDDIILTKNFRSKVEAVISQYPTAVIQFFSMRGADLTVGSRWDRQYQMSQCTYIPAKYAPAILAYGATWVNRPANPFGYDTMIHEWLKTRREPHLISVPSLVQHRIVKSRIHRGRSSKRQSQSFVDPDE